MGYTADEDARSLDDKRIAKEFRLLTAIIHKTLCCETLTADEVRFALAHIGRMNTALGLMGEKP